MIRRISELLARHAAPLALACVLVFASGAVAQQVIELDRIVAVVNDDVIVESELNARVRTIKAQLRQQGTQLPPEDVLRQQVLERLVLERLQLQIAETNGIRVEDEALNQAVETVARQNNLSVEEFRDILERDGFDFTKFREDIRNEIMIARIQQRQVENRISVTDRDIDNYLATVKQQGGGESEYLLHHILIALPEAASADEITRARARADELVTQLRGGADFAEVAVRESDGQQALEGGNLGWIKGPDLPTIFAEVVKNLREGEISEPVRSSSGFHIVKVAGIRGAGGRHVVQQTKARHILVRPNEITTEAEARVRLEQLKIRIENGEDFGELARAHSDDRGSALNGGDLGWVNPGGTVPNFENMMNSLEPGQVSEPFETRFGLHIVQVLERREYDDTEQARRSKAAEVLRKRKQDEELQNWLRQIRDEAYVELRLEER
ncbi:MAG: peptidylprolyl isomerase [Gammaproteobacteria bacterium]|nr:peptidylprolyl isomerase [Gammaproteobacteria bacterium]